MPRKDHLPRQTRQEHITLQPNRSIEFRVTDDFGSFSPPHWHDALEIICCYFSSLSGKAVFIASSSLGMSSFGAVKRSTRSGIISSTFVIVS